MAGRHLPCIAAHVRARYAAAVLLALAPAAGCRHGGSSTSAASGRGGSGTGKLIAILSPAKTSEFHRELPKGAIDEARALGWPTPIDKAPQREDDYAGQVAMAEDIIEQRPDAISVCGINPQALDNIVKKANAAGIPIFVHNQITPVQGDVVSYIGYDERAGGKQCGDEAVKLLNQKYGKPQGAVAILDGEPGAHTDERAGGFKDALKPYPGIRVVAELNGKWDRAMGASTTKDWLQRYPELDLVFGCSEAMSQGAAEAARDAGHPLLTIGIDGNPTGLEDVRDGKLTATLAVQPRVIGADIVKTMKTYFDGGKPPKVVLTPCVLVTRDNAAQFIKK